MLPEGPNNKSLKSAFKATEVCCPYPITSWLPGVPALLMEPAMRETQADTLLFLHRSGSSAGSMNRTSIHSPCMGRAPWRPSLRLIMLDLRSNNNSLSVMDVMGRTDLGTRQTCKRGQEQD